MAIFEYACSDCNDVTEVIVRGEEPTHCLCGGELTKMVSMPSRPVFKGEGFYCNDYPKTKKSDE